MHVGYDGTLAIFRQLRLDASSVEEANVRVGSGTLLLALAVAPHLVVDEIG